MGAMNLFSQFAAEPTYEEIYPGAVLMRGLALEQDVEFFAAVERVLAAAPLRNATTPSGLPMQVLVSDCGTPEAFRRRWNGRQQVYTQGDNGWKPQPTTPPSDRRMWPPIPRVLSDFAIRCAVRSGFPQFRPDACHINRYQAGTKLGIHQDRQEFDLFQPIVSVSFGLECIFLLGGFQRTNPTKRILLEHGDVIVWGGPSRMRFHGVLPLKPGHHPITGPYRYNLTFRKVA
jgi:alkylated DNA repair protein (DNA oxidative demethylase)